MNRKAVTPVVSAVLIILAVLVVVGFGLALAGYAAAAAIADLPAVDYDGEFDAVKFILAQDEGFSSDASAQMFRKDTTNDKWTGNVTLTNFTVSVNRQFDLYFEVDDGPMKELDDISIDPVAGTIADNMTLSLVKLFNYKTGVTIKDWDTEIEDNKLDSEYVGSLSSGKYVLRTIIRSLNLPSTDIGCASIYTVKIGADTDGDVGDIEADIYAAQKLA